MAWSLRTPRLILRHFVPADLQAVIDLDSDPEVMRFLTGGVPSLPEYVEKQAFPRLLSVPGPLGGRAFVAADLADTREFIGWFHLKPGHYWPDELELGYRLARRFWNRGLATEASIAIRDFTFDSLDAPKLIACAMRANTASRRVMEKLGMTFESEFVENRWPGPPEDDRTAVKLSMLNPRTRPLTSPAPTPGPPRPPAC